MVNGSPSLLRDAAAPRADAYAWRMLATALSFILFGIGAVVLGAVVFPAMRMLPGGREARRHRARAIVRRSFRAFGGLMQGLRALDYEFVGAERLGRPGQLVVANHPSLIDVVFLLGFTPNASCVVKDALWRNPFTRWPVTVAEYVRNRPTDMMLEQAAATLLASQSVILFPEGTRTTPGKPLVFQRGAASIAVKAARTVTPVFIRCVPTTLTKADPWYRVPHRRVQISFVVGEDFDLQPFKDIPSPALAARAFNDHMRERFERELTR